VNKWRLILLTASLVSCGVKGPPEPPLPTEASLKKQSLIQESQVEEKAKTPTTKKAKAQ
jgi:predicted small lipoprotein YifL